jgi:hypothetical protein
MSVHTSDLIKAVGFLTIYWGYLELEIDTLIRSAAPICPLPQDNAGVPLSLEKFLERSFRNRVEYRKRSSIWRTFHA